MQGAARGGMRVALRKRGIAETLSIPRLQLPNPQILLDIGQTPCTRRQRLAVKMHLVSGIKGRAQLLNIGISATVAPAAPAACVDIMAGGCAEIITPLGMASKKGFARSFGLCWLATRQMGLDHAAALAACTRGLATKGPILYAAIELLGQLARRGALTTPRHDTGRYAQAKRKRGAGSSQIHDHQPAIFLGRRLRPPLRQRGGRSSRPNMGANSFSAQR